MTAMWVDFCRNREDRQVVQELVSKCWTPLVMSSVEQTQVPPVPAAGWIPHHSLTEI